MKIFKKSPYLDYRYTKESYLRMFIRWAYAKYLDELYIPSGSTYVIGHGYEDISHKYNGYGRHITINTPNHPDYIRKGCQYFTFDSHLSPVSPRQE